MALVLVTAAFTRRREGLAGSGAGDDGALAQSGEAKGKRPSPNPAEVVLLSVAADFRRLDFEDRSRIDFSIG